MTTVVEHPTDGLSDTQRQIVDLAREFAREHIAPHAAEWDRTKTFPRPVIDELGRLGFLGMTVPERYEGMGIDTVTYLLALEEIAAADASIAVSISIQNAIPATMLVRHGSPAQQERWLKPLLDGSIRSGFSMTEPQVASSDATNIQCEIKRDGDSYVINGRKWFTSGAMNEDCVAGRTCRQGPARSTPGSGPGADPSWIWGRAWGASACHTPCRRKGA